MNKKVNGFTLVEMVVVIAIISVLASILIPSMVGYVTKSRISAVNSNAKSLSNAAITSLTELDTEGLALSTQDFVWKKELADGWDNHTNNTAEAAMASKVRKYFNGVERLDEASYRITSSTVVATAVEKNSFYGAYPNHTETERTQRGYAKDIRFTTTEDLLNWAESKAM